VLPHNVEITDYCDVTSPYVLIYNKQLDERLLYGIASFPIIISIRSRLPTTNQHANGLLTHSRRPLFVHW